MGQLKIAPSTVAMLVMLAAILPPILIFAMMGRFISLEINGHPTVTATSTPTVTATLTPTATATPTVAPTTTPPTSTIDSRPRLIITIDDGWDPEAFDWMLAILNEREVQATFFLISGAARQTLGHQRMAALAQGGHEIAYHSTAHEEAEELGRWSADRWSQDYQQWHREMRALLPPEHWGTIRPYARPPYGLRTSGFLEFCERVRLSCWWWTAGPGSLSRDFPIKDGDVFLFHVRQSDLEYLESLLNRSEEFRFLSIGEFLEETS